MALEIRNVEMKVGNTLKIKGKISEEADRFTVNLGSDADHIGLHFQPRFHDGDDGTVIVCNSKCADGWDSEQREHDFPFSKGEKFKMSITFKGDVFEIKLPNESVIEFPNRFSLETISFVSVSGDFKLVSFGCR
ncbi:galectin-2-like [Rhinoraja longicauda]